MATTKGRALGSGDRLSTSNGNQPKQLEPKTKQSDARRLLIRNRHRWRSGTWSQQLQSDLNELIALMGNGPVDVFLVGGLGLAVRSEIFYRNHADIDLAVFSNDLPLLVEYLRPLGFALAQSQAGFAVSPWHRLDVTRPTDPATAIAGPDRVRLRILRTGGRRRWQRSPSRTDFIDLLLLSDSPHGVVLHGYDRVVPRQDFFPTIELASGARILLPNLQYKRHLPCNWPRQRRDLQAAELQPIARGVLKS